MGVYPVFFDIEDSAGNAAEQKTRTVYIEDPATPYPLLSIVQDGCGAIQLLESPFLGDVFNGGGYFEYDATAHITLLPAEGAQVFLDGVDITDQLNASLLTLPLAGEMLLVVHLDGQCEGSDLCSDAPYIREGMWAEGSTQEATGSAWSRCGYADRYDVWYRYQAPDAGVVSISLDGSDFNTTLAIYDACEGRELDCNNDYCRRNAGLSFEVQTGEEYWIRIAGYYYSRGQYRDSIDQGRTGRYLL